MTPTLDPIPSREQCILQCARCDIEIGLIVNDWIALTSSYARPVQEFPVQNLVVQDKIQVVPNGGTTNVAEGCHMASLTCSHCKVMVGQRCIFAPEDKSTLIHQQFFKLSRVQLKDATTFEKQALTFSTSHEDLLHNIEQDSGYGVSLEKNGLSRLQEGPSVEGHTNGYQAGDKSRLVFESHASTIPHNNIQQDDGTTDGTTELPVNDDASIAALESLAGGFPLRQWIARVALLDEQHAENTRRLAAQETRMFRVETIIRAEDQFTRSLRDQIENLGADHVAWQNSSEAQAELLSRQQIVVQRQQDEIAILKNKLDALQQMVISLVGSGRLTESAPISAGKKRKRCFQEDNGHSKGQTGRPRLYSATGGGSEQEGAGCEPWSVEPRTTNLALASAEPVDFSDDQSASGLTETLDTSAVVGSADHCSGSARVLATAQETSLTSAATLAPDSDSSVPPIANGHIAASIRRELESKSRTARTSSRANRSVSSSSTAAATLGPTGSRPRKRPSQMPSASSISKAAGERTLSPVAGAVQAGTYQGSYDEDRSQDELAHVEQQNGVASTPRAIQGNISTQMQIPIQANPTQKVSKNDHDQPEQTTEVENEDECTVCLKRGKLICCDTCPKAYHRRCLDRDSSASADRDGHWHCPLCISAKRSNSETATARPSKTLDSHKSNADRRRLIERNRLARDAMDREESSATKEMGRRPMQPL